MEIKTVEMLKKSIFSQFVMIFLTFSKWVNIFAASFASNAFAKEANIYIVFLSIPLRFFSII